MTTFDTSHSREALGTAAVDVGVASADTADARSLRQPIQLLLKRSVDVVGAVVGLVLLLPLFLVVAGVIVTDRQGSALFRQVRAGKDGVPFTIVKFRTMRPDCESDVAILRELNDVDGILFKLEHDPRVTRVGRVLRKFSLDELPQLWNVLRGEMSLVGPRPALPSEVFGYCDRAARRLEVVPGLTGPWQVGGRSTLGWAEGIDLDLHYVDNWSFRYDAVLLLKTFRAVVRPVGAY